MNYKLIIIYSTVSNDGIPVAVQCIFLYNAPLAAEPTIYTQYRLHW